MMRKKLTLFVLLCMLTLLGACSDNKTALKTVIHADIGSYSAAISSDLNYLMTGSIGGFGRLWDLTENKVPLSLQHQANNGGSMIAAACSAPSEILVTMEQQSLARRMIPSGKLMGYLPWAN